MFSSGTTNVDNSPASGSAHCRKHRTLNENRRLRSQDVRMWRTHKERIQKFDEMVTLFSLISRNACILQSELIQLYHKRKIIRLRLLVVIFSFFLLSSHTHTHTHTAAALRFLIFLSLVHKNEHGYVGAANRCNPLHDRQVGGTSPGGPHQEE